MNNRNFVLFSFLFIGILFLLLTPILCENKDNERNSIVQVNPECPENICNKTVHIVYIRSSSKKDVLHFLYSAGTFTPTPSIVLMRSTDLKSNISIMWNNFTSNNKEYRLDSIKKIGSDFTSLFGLVFTKLHQYDDTEDKLKMTGNITTWGFDQFQWDFKVKDGEFELNSTSVNSKNNLFKKNGSIGLKFSYETISKSGRNMPKLFFNSNNTQFDLVIENPEYFVKNPRFAVEFALININSTGEMTLTEVKSIDDESSPGVFESLNYYGQKLNSSEVTQTFVQWKPVCYVKKDDFSINSISVAKNMGDPKPLTNINDIIKNSLVYYAYGNEMNTSTHVSSLNVTFGVSKDKFLKDYTLWTASFGYGKPPTYELSITIIMVIIFGLGIPFLIVVIGSIYLVVKKKFIRKNTGSYGQIDEVIN